jgi:outer membrane lipoprotein SlyB
MLKLALEAQCSKLHVITVPMSPSRMNNSLPIRLTTWGLLACAYAALPACSPSGETPVAPASPPAAAAPLAAPVPEAIPEPAPAPAPVKKPVTKKVVHKPAPVPVAAPPPPVVVAAPLPVVHPKPPPPPVCTNCGIITAINPVTVQGKGTGLGAVAGGVAGIVIGNQIGAGSGKTIAKIAGAAGGAFVGNKVEQKARAATHYEIKVHLENGTDTSVTQDGQPTLPVGAAVRVVDGTVIAK